MLNSDQRKRKSELQRYRRLQSRQSKSTPEADKDRKRASPSQKCRKKKILNTIIIEDESDISSQVSLHYNLRSRAPDDIESSISVSSEQTETSVDISTQSMNSNSSTSSTVYMRKRRADEDIRNNDNKRRRESYAKKIAMKPKSIHHNLFIEVIRDVLKKLFKNLEKYCFDSTFLEPITEHFALYRRKQLFRIRVHRRGNDPDNDYRYKYYRQPKVWSIFVQNFVNGNYPNMINNLCEGDIDCIDIDELNEYDEIDMTVAPDIYIRLCDPLYCPDLTDDMVICFDAIMKEFLKCLWAGNLPNALQILNNMYVHLGNLIVFDFLRKFYNCYMGARTIFNKLNLISKCLDALINPEDINFENLPKFLQFEILLKMPREHTPSCMSAVQVVRRFQKEFRDFNANDNNLEIHPCELCERLCKPTKLGRISTNFNRNWIQPSLLDKDIITACRDCRDSIRNGIIPRFCVANGFHVTDIPYSINNLNFLGHNLIQLLHPIIGTINIRNKSDIPIGMVGKNGTCTFHSVPLDFTLERLAQTLPDASNVLIEVGSVDGHFKDTLVEMDDVFMSLFWLKHNNHFYRDIKIDIYFQLHGNQIQINDRFRTSSSNITALKSLLSPEHSTIIGTGSMQYAKICRNRGNRAPTHFERYSMRLHDYKPIEIDKKNIDAMVFPYLLPDGKFGWDYNRQRDVPFVLYCRARLLHQSRRFSNDRLYPLVVAGIIEQRQLQSCLAIAIRQSKLKLTARHVRSMLGSKRVEDQVLFSSMLSDIRGYAAYWDQVKKLLRSFVQTFGPPTWWITLNPDITRWKKLHKAYSEIYSKVVNADNIYQMVALDPLIFTRYSHSRFRKIWRFIHSDAQPLGFVTNSFRRIEYQEGGLNHCHGFLWIKGSPSKKSPSSEIVEFINKYVTSYIPPVVEDPVLNEVVESCQRHNTPCGPTCDVVEIVNGVEYHRCRFEFPRRVIGKTILRREYKSLMGRTTRRLYDLACSKEEEHINHYNPAILLMNNANMDIQYLVDGVPAVINYSTYYSAKNSGGRKTLYDDKRHSIIQTNDLFSLGIDLLKHKVMPPTEAIDIIMGENLYEFSASHVNINTNIDSERKRIVVGDNILKQLPDNARAYMENIFDDYYINRPTELENVCLFSFCISFEIEYYTRSSSGKIVGYAKNAKGRKEADFIEIDGTTCSESYKNGPYFHSGYHVDCVQSPFNDFRYFPDGFRMKLRNSEKEIVKRARQRFPDVYIKPFKPGDKATREDFYRRLCVLFIPFRDETRLKSFFAHIESPYEQRWNEYLSTAGDICKKDIVTYLDRYLIYFEEERTMFDNFSKKKPSIKRNCPTDSVLFDFSRGLIEEDKLETDVKNLPKDQREVYDDVVEKITKVVDNNAEPVCFFLSGPGGTGKSYLLQLIDQKITSIYTSTIEQQKNTPAVIFCAPTGVAALHDNGFTIHKLFGIDIDSYRLLSDEKLNTLRNQLINCKLVIIDEISMCSNELLAIINLRLQEVTGINEKFGGISVLLCGDFMQLKPPNGNFAFEPLNKLILEKILKSAADVYDMWSTLNVIYYELYQNKRQSNDFLYGQILENLRIGQLKQDELVILQERVQDIPESIDKLQYAIELYHDIRNRDRTCIVLFAKNVDVDEFNEKYLLKYYKENLVVINAIHSGDLKNEDLMGSESESGSDDVIKYKNVKRRVYQEARYRLRRQFNPFNVHAENSKKLKPCKQKPLVIGIGVRVMLTRNIDLKMKLVNGSIGDVVGFEYNDALRNIVTSVKVKFDDINEPVIIQRSLFTSDESYRSQISIKQFPLKVSFACTIHKTQSKSLNCAIISLEKVFESGQAYVALSRLKSMNGLYLLDCPKHVFRCDQLALNEVNKLRKSVGMLCYPCSVIEQVNIQNCNKSPVVLQPPARDLLKKTDDVIDGYVPQEDEYATTMQTVLRLPNPSNYCFLNSAVNLINTAILFRNSICDNVGFSDFGSTHYFLAQVLLREATDTIELRQSIDAFSGRQNEMEQEDAGHAFFKLYESVDINSKNLVIFSYDNYISCNCNNGQRRYLRTSSNVAFISLKIDPNIERNTLETMKENWFFDIARDACNECRGDKIKERVLHISNTQHYLFLEICSWVDDGTIDTHYPINLTMSDIDEFLFGVSWRLIGAIEHLGDRNHGHYVTWKRIDNGWIRIDDAHPSYINSLPMNINIFTVLLYEKN